MEVPFIAIYHFFRKHKAVFYTVLTALFAVSAFFASEVRFEENINSFLPDDGDSRLAVEVFDNLTVKDKIVIMLSDAEDRGSLISASDSIESRLADSPAAPLIKGIMSEVYSQGSSRHRLRNSRQPERFPGGIGISRSRQPYLFQGRLHADNADITGLQYRQHRHE